MKTIQSRRCPVCDLARSESAFEQEFSSLPGMEIGPFHQEVRCCHECGMVYVADFLRDEDLSAYYSTMSTYEYAECGYQYPQAHMKRSEQQFHFITKFVERFAEVLDIGCSLGYTLSLFKSAGSHVLGIEPSPKLRQIAKELYDIEVITGFIDRKILLNNSFDLVILSHVAEHLKSPLTVLKSVKEVLTNSGLLYLEVPSIELFDERDLFQFSFEHINYFSHGTLSNLMHRAGFEEIDHVIFENDDGTAPFYPTLGTLWRKTEREYPLINRYPHDRKVIGRYVELVNRFKIHLNKLIAEIVNKYDRIAIWGAGTLTAQLLAQTALDSSNVVVIYDNDPKKHGLLLANIPIRKPDMIENFAGQNDIDAIVVGSWSSKEEITQQIHLVIKTKIPIFVLA